MATVIRFTRLWVNVFRLFFFGILLYFPIFHVQNNKYIKRKRDRIRHSLLGQRSISGFPLTLLLKTTLTESIERFSSLFSWLSSNSQWNDYTKKGNTISIPDRADGHTLILYFGDAFTFSWTKGNLLWSWLRYF